MVGSSLIPVNNRLSNIKELSPALMQLFRYLGHLTTKHGQ